MESFWTGGQDALKDALRQEQEEKLAELDKLNLSDDAKKQKAQAIKLEYKEKLERSEASLF